MMGNQNSMKEFIKSISGQANILTIPRIYVDYMGSLDGGLILSQLIFWSDKGKSGGGWFYKTYAEWTDETTLSKYEVSKQVKILVSRGVLETKLKKANGAPTVHYHFLFDEFQKSIVKFLDNRKLRNFTMESEETLHSITEDYTEDNIQNIDGANAPEKLFPFLDLNIDAAKEQIAGIDQSDKLQAVLAEERNGKNRKGIIRFIEVRLNGEADSDPAHNPWGEMFKGLADCCDYDTGILTGEDRGQLAHAARTMLANGYVLQDIVGFRPWWDAETWQGKKGQPPTLNDVRRDWGRYRKSQNGQCNGDTSTGPKLSPEELAEYKRLEREMEGNH